MKREMERALKRAVKAAGGKTAFARILKSYPQKVHYWVEFKKQLPAEFVLIAEAATGVSRHDLRPDIYPPELAP